jgi:hypothetical protein
MLGGVITSLSEVGEGGEVAGVVPMSYRAADGVLGSNCGACCIDVVVSGEGFAYVILSGKYIGGGFCQNLLRGKSRGEVE